jgi:hypothetical protein
MLLSPAQERNKAEATTLAATMKTSISGAAIAIEASRKSERLRLRMTRLLMIRIRSLR